MKTSQELPSVLAVRLGIDCGLLIKRENGADHDKIQDLEERMRWFQQMAVSSPFEDCMVVYHGMQLEDDQISKLKLIHRTTKPWMTGHVVGVLLEKIDNSKMGNRDFAEAVRVLTEQLEESGSGVTKAMNGIVVQSAKSEAA